MLAPRISWIPRESRRSRSGKRKVVGESHCMKHGLVQCSIASAALEVARVSRGMVVFKAVKKSAVYATDPESPKDPKEPENHRNPKALPVSVCPAGIQYDVEPPAYAMSISG